MSTHAVPHPPTHADQLITQVRQSPGVIATSYDPANQILTLQYNPGQTDISAIENLAHQHGATLRTQPAPRDAASPLTQEDAELAALPWMIRLTIITLVSLALGWLVEDLTMLPITIPWTLYAIAYFSGGFYSIQNAWESLKARQFDVNFLMIIAALGAAIIGQPREGAVLMFLFALSNTLETYAMGRTHASIRALLEMAPTTARVLHSEGDTVTEIDVPIEQVRINEIVRVRPGEQIPTDGTVFRGDSAVNEASITGESMPAEKRPGTRVFAGTLNGQGALDVRVTTAVQDSTLSRIVKIVREAREQKAQSQDFTDRVIGQYYAYAVVIITILAIIVPLFVLNWDLSTTLYRAMTLMVVASPCALVISIPAALLSALASSARGGVLFKGGANLEAATRVRVVALDKTGTLTTGRPGVVAVIPLAESALAQLPLDTISTPETSDSSVDDHTFLQHLLHTAPTPRGDLIAPPDDLLGSLTDAQARLLTVAAGIESFSEHPLARAIVQGAEERGMVVPNASHFAALTGSGARAQVAGQELRIGRPEIFQPLDADIQHTIETQAQQGRTVVLLGDEQPWGLIAIADTVRPEAINVVARLKQAQIERVVLLTGDNRHVAENLAHELGVDEVHAELLPAEKVAVIRQLQADYGPVAMIGDGINDAPALATATLGVAMGAAGTDVALESADVLLMSDDLSRLPSMLRLARRTRRIVRQNLIFAGTVMIVMMFLAIGGVVSLPLGVVAHEGGTLLVVANGMRLLIANE